MRDATVLQTTYRYEARSIGKLRCSDVRLVPTQRDGEGSSMSTSLLCTVALSFSSGRMNWLLLLLRKSTHISSFVFMTAVMTATKLFNDSKNP